jgi:choline dehydrogenase-like flavoprotein
MLQDALTTPSDTELSADVCIVGGGPAGMTLATEFASHGQRAIVLESGGLVAEPDAQDLNDGRVVGMDYAGLQPTRHRQVGGTANTWNTPLADSIGAKYVPLDPADVAHGSGDAFTDWPFDLAHLRPYYERAQALCGLGPFDYTGARWCDAGDTFSLPDERLRRSVYQFGPADVFTAILPERMGASDTVTLLYHATACGLRFDGPRDTVSSIEVTTLAGGRFRIHARVFVLAAGAVENARLLLLSREPGQDAPGDGNGWVGRCFMEHPRDQALRLIPDRAEVYRQAAFYDRHEGMDGTTVAGRIAVEPPVGDGNGDAGKPPSASISLLPLPRAPTVGERLLRRAVRHLPRCFQRHPPSGYGWSRLADPERFFRGFQLLVNLEQRPEPENRLVLGRDVDRLGLSRVELHWQWRPEDQASLERLRDSIEGALEAAGIGRVERSPDAAPDLNAHHHAGTTRMHRDPRYGVVDGDTRVHGVDNLYVTGASVFPTAGFANPTLTIVALALRLGDHLRNRL